MIPHDSRRAAFNRFPRNGRNGYGETSQIWVFAVVLVGFFLPVGSPTRRHQRPAAAGAVG